VPLVHSDLKQARRSASTPRPPGTAPSSSARKHGYRNAQATVIAPTGTIGLVMDCDTTGIEPDFALVKFKKLAGGGYFKIINARGARGAAHARLLRSQIAEIDAYAVGHGNLNQAPGINPGTLRAKGFTDEKIAALNTALKSAFDIKFAFNQWTLGADCSEDGAGLHRRAAQRFLLRHAGRRSASRRRTSRPPTSMSAAP
jgi:ribonucleoside-diphosphate reductase alpha chain